MHKQTTVTIHGIRIQVDSKITSLIGAMNSIPGIRTTYSCQGAKDNAAYVQFTGEHMFVFISELMPLIWKEERRLQIIAKNKRKISYYGFSAFVESGGCVGTMTLRWHPRDYVLVLRMIEKVRRKGER
jgi:hypothetical protein